MRGYQWLEQVLRGSQMEYLLMSGVFEWKLAAVTQLVLL